ncbi:SRPBCC domain-containing protein [Haloechinothrix sp. YIM 98757]|uniref:SRPBCC domain-containing protein n=1 Tax=Haloechinothrix aidingensis TaxID=2752311 RepID=A0A838A8R9_9PSEU|nr:SRPBCC domain-containing protein [Haloechinothrix aidingensis]MBA0125865.1 SRPBCC domain-containing protein [Haloechinothrix aidingensis]
MSAEHDEPTSGRVSSPALRAATGMGWTDWLATLDSAGAEQWDHKRIVGHLEQEHAETTTAWWRQSIAVGYEQARGTRVPGQTADAGFQVGVQRSLPASRSAVWECLVTRPELWLGPGAAVTFEPGARYRVTGGTDTPPAHGEIRVVKPEHRIRMTWQPDGWQAPATLQLTLAAAASGKTRLTVHVEKLPDATARTRMREHWKAVQQRIAAAVT